MVENCNILHVFPIFSDRFLRSREEVADRAEK